MKRAHMLEYLEQVARPPLLLASQGRLRAHLPVEQKGEDDRTPYTYFELIGRLLCGIAPWLELEGIVDPTEQALQQELRQMAVAALAGQVDPASPDYTLFGAYGTDNSQLIVDAAFLAQALLRAPNVLWHQLKYTTQQHILDVFLLLRTKRTPENNWVLFSGLIETALSRFGGQYHAGTIRHCYQTLEQWYVGDGWYSDGPRFAQDYYNSLVIHPMLLDIAEEFPWEFPPGFVRTYTQRAQRYTQHMLRSTHPDGSYPVTGRSLAYRCGVFHLPALLALKDDLPEDIPPGTLRNLLGAVISRTLGPASYGAQGILNIGLQDHQPRVGERYISTGSLYLCSTAFLPLGLPAEHIFWTQPAGKTPYEQAWSGEDIAADQSIV